MKNELKSIQNGQLMHVTISKRDSFIYKFYKRIEEWDHFMIALYKIKCNHNLIGYFNMIISRKTFAQKFQS